MVLAIAAVVTAFSLGFLGAQPLIAALAYPLFLLADWSLLRTYSADAGLKMRTVDVWLVRSAPVSLAALVASYGSGWLFGGAVLLSLS